MDLVKSFNPEESARELRTKVGVRSQVTIEIVAELYKARSFYSNSGFRSDLVSSDTRLMTFEAYLAEAGLTKPTAYRWLERYVPEEQKLLTYEELTEKKDKEKLSALSKEERDRKLIAEYRKTGKKPAGWDRSLDYRIKKDEENIGKQTERIEKEKRDRDQRAKEYKSNAESASLSDAFQTVAGAFIEKANKRNEWKEKIRLSDGGKEDAFMDAIIDYMETLESDTRRIEACNNIIKICRNISVELQKIK